VSNNTKVGPSGHMLNLIRDTKVVNEKEGSFKVLNSLSL
jgi:hypothetical protein